MSADVSVDIRIDRRGAVVSARFDVAAGGILALMGPSGAGKTTILEAVAGLVPLDEGAIRIGPDTVATPRRQTAAQRRGTVLLRQDPCLFPHLSARENVAFGLRAQRHPAAGARDVADAWLARVGLEGRGDRMPSALSGGQQQRVALARALAARPRVVLLDEPLTALDPETAAALRSMLAEQLRSSGTTAVFATHDALDAAAVADRLAVVEAGEVTQIGGVVDVLRAPATAFGAAAAGLNRVVGHRIDGTWRAGAMTIADGQGEADRSAALFRPADVRLEPLDGPVRDDEAPPGPGSRDDEVVWTAEVVRLEPTVAGVRVFVGDPLVAVDLPLERAVDLRPGVRVRLGVATDAVTRV
ncbi:MAG: ATP-binding cassette domain-containing protein [Microbacterium arborescens]